jgi:hypothetical protein
MYRKNHDVLTEKTEITETEMNIEY